MSLYVARHVVKAVRATPTAHEAAAFFFNSRRSVSTLDLSRHPTPRPSTRRVSTHSPESRQQSHRPFSSSLAGRATTTTIARNPRNDEDGQLMTINISTAAAARLKAITSTPQKRNTLATSPITPDSHLRVTVTSGGCHGFQYLMSLEPESKIDAEEDTVFVAATAEEGEGGKGRAEVVLDEPSLELLKGSTVDFVTELIGSQFKIVGNPRASSSCGCGTSFDIQ
ncbi:Iron-sulfur assembly protein 2 [Cyphellophora attinorum]|uniref:Iron-sulfur assembly protein 2 n=1 Tax=Cyphellophora attinorum TaxID=1664694 RepID=A0A0N1HRU7_9EURO|nr:Iron-sulfur assembly protein 2 [Phialophora attinorum]KPI41143.1 Iron-sulfur assembly protein 2 [Phialophora attinorum]